MQEKPISRDDLLKMIATVDTETFVIWSDKKWKYADPTKEQGVQDQGNCNTLDVALAIEQRPGIVIYIPGKTLEDIKNGVDKSKD